MSASELDLERIRSEFPILERKVYLNSCSLGALSRRADAYLDDFREHWHAEGAAAWYEHWLGRVGELRGRVAAFLGASSQELALLPSTSAALSVVAESVDYRRRSKVVCTELDFPTQVYQWRAKPEVEVVVLESPDGIRIDPDQFADAVDEDTMFLATSHVFFTTGFTQDLAALATIAHEKGTYCLIDGYQAAGQVPVDVREAGIDMYTCGPLKWLCGGPGLAYLYVRRDLVRRLEPRITSWFATREPFAFDPFRFEPRDDAGRFELGTPSLPTLHLALGGQEIVDEVGMEAIARRNRSLVERLCRGVEDAGLSLRAASDPERRSAIVTVAHPDPPGAVAHLAERDIIVDARPGLVRASPHFYNTLEEIDRFVEGLAGFPA